MLIRGYVMPHSHRPGDGTSRRHANLSTANRNPTDASCQTVSQLVVSPNQGSDIFIFWDCSIFKSILCTMTARRNAFSKGVQEPWERSHAPVTVNTPANKWIAQHSTAQPSPARHSTAQHSTARHSTAQHSTAQHGSSQHSPAQHSTAQHSTAQHGSSQ
jgi:hypothetical protein